jgi:hypothetical protein
MTLRNSRIPQRHHHFAEGVAAAGLENELLEGLPGSDIRKVALADLLLTCTVVRQSWDRGPAGDVQRGKREPAGPPVSGEAPAQITTSFKKLHQRSQDLLTDP